MNEHQASLIFIPARKSGIEVPVDLVRYDPNRYPHWNLLMECAGSCMGGGSLRSMAERIAIARQLVRIPPASIRDRQVDCDIVRRSGLIHC